MDLLTFISDPLRKSQLAARTESSEGYLWQVATNWRGKRPSPELAQAIERESGEIGPECVPKSTLRPDLWPDREWVRTADGNIVEYRVPVDRPEDCGLEPDAVHRQPAAENAGDAAQAAETSVLRVA